jgi:hypothetical protein
LLAKASGGFDHYDRRSLTAGARITWRTAIADELLKQLNEANFIGVFIGIESPDNARYPTTPLGLITVAALLPQAWTIKLVDRNAEVLSDDDRIIVLCRPRATQRRRPLLPYRPIQRTVPLSRPRRRLPPL